MNPKALKYILIVGYLVLSLLNIFYFYPLQERFYLNLDIQHIEGNGYITILQTLLITTGITLVIFRDSIKFLSNTTKSVLLAVVLLLGVSQKSIMSFILSSNRLSEKEIISKKFMVGSMAGSTLSKENFHLLDLESNKIILDEQLLSRVYKDNLKDQDTISVPLIVGLWKIEFLAPE